MSDEKPNGNGKLKRYATIGTIAATSVVVTTFALPRLMALVRQIDLLVWVQEHRQQYPSVMEDYNDFQDDTRRQFEEAARERTELRDLVKTLALDVAATNKQALVATTLSSANQDLLYELLALEHKDRGMPPPKRPKLLKPEVEGVP